MHDPACAWVRDRIPRHAANALPPEERGRFDEHLRYCEPCRQEARMVGEIRDVRPTLGDAPRGRIRSALLETPSPSGRPRSGSRPGQRRGPLVAGGVAAAGVAALGALWMLPGNGVGPEEPALPGEQADEVVSGDVPEDWVVANDPVLTELPEDALEHLLQELEE